MSRHSRFSKYRWRMGGASIPFRTIWTLFLSGLVLGVTFLLIRGILQGTWIRKKYDPYPSEQTLYDLDNYQLTVFLPEETLSTDPPTDEILTQLFSENTLRRPMPGDTILIYCARTEHMHSFVKVDPTPENGMKAWIEMVPIREIPATVPTVTPTPHLFPTATCTPMVYPPTSTPKPTQTPEK